MKTLPRICHICKCCMCAFQELIFPVLTILFLVLLAWVVSLARVKTTTSDRAVHKVNWTFPAHRMCWNCTVYFLCSPNMPEIRTLMDRTLAYLESPQPNVSYYRSSSEAEEAYLNITTSVHNADSRVIGIDFTESAGSSSIRYSLRFRARDVADTEVFFNHACEWCCLQISVLCFACVHFYHGDGDVVTLLVGHQTCNS